MSLTKKLKSKAGTASRKQKVALFYSRYRKGKTVLDVGVSSEAKDGPSKRNYFLKTFAYDPKYYTGLGVQDLDGMDRLFPGKRFTRYPGGRFPFSDQEFDWVFSNAVVEHVGGPAKQLEFVNEMLRVGREVFFTTPNKYFPFETHTNVFFLHWSDALFHWWCDRTGRTERRHNLRLLSCHSLRKLLQASIATRYTIRKMRFMGITMTMSVICRSDPAPVAPVSEAKRRSVTDAETGAACGDMQSLGQADLQFGDAASVRVKAPNDMAQESA